MSDFNDRVIPQRLARLASMLLLAASTPASAAQWIRVASGDTGTVGDADIESVKQFGNYRTVWVRWDYSRDRTKKAHESKELYEIGCTGRTLKLIQWIDYARDGHVLASNSEDSSVARAEAVAPDTIGESVVKAVCSWIIDLPPPKD